jgi:2-polyprenyl-3-methyl-5-hydroxy-6-metoxy-1,4-benzoquinol methylase
MDIVAEIVSDIMTIENIDQQEAVERIKIGPEALEDEWGDFIMEREVTNKEIEAFWAKSVWNLYATANRNLALDLDKRQRRLTEVCVEPVLDFGAGIGTDILLLARGGYRDVTYHDVGPTHKFTVKRFQLHDRILRLFNGKRYNTIILSDVIPCLGDPRPHLDYVYKLLAPGGTVLMSRPSSCKGPMPGVDIEVSEYIKEQFKKHSNVGKPPKIKYL